MTQRAALAEAPPPGREAVAACIAARLRALGHPADLLTGEAVAALTQHAGGSIPRLRAALAGALFLASTEEAPRIERSHVERAVANLPEPAPPAGTLAGATAGADATAQAPGIGPAPMPARPRRVWLLAGMAAAAVAAIVIAPPVRHDIAMPPRDAGMKPPAAAPAAPPAATAPAQAAASRAPADGAAPGAAGTAAGVPLRPQAGPPPLPAPVYVPALPLPPDAQPLRAAVPAAPAPAARRPVIVVLRFRARDPLAGEKLAEASHRLRLAGFMTIYALPWHGRRAPPAVTYFHDGDRNAAADIAALIEPPGGQVRGAARRRHPAGTIEALVH